MIRVNPVFLLEALAVGDVLLLEEAHAADVLAVSVLSDVRVSSSAFITGHTFSLARTRLTEPRLAIRAFVAFLSTGLTRRPRLLKAGFRPASQST